MVVIIGQVLQQGERLSMKSIQMKFIFGFLSILVLLSSTWASVSTIPNPESYKVTGLAKYGAKEEMYAGLMPLSFEEEKNSEGSFFFWLAKKRKNPLRANEPKKLIIWLNGGPGCSSMVGMMWENGPFTIAFGGEGQSKYDLKYNPYAWNEVADVIFVEQPIRTGFAAAAENAHIIRNEGQIGSDFRHFLLSFYQVFPEYKGIELFLTGESYAGFYIPWIANTIVREQLEEITPGHFIRNIDLDGINLVGAAIGNGAMDAIHQEPSYAEYAYTHGLIPLAAKLKFDHQWTQCLENLQQTGRPLTRGSFDKCRMMTDVLKAAGQPNEYNTATFVNYDRITKAGGPFDAFFQDPEIQEALHVRGYDVPGLNFMPEHWKNISGIANGKTASTSSPKHKGFHYEPPFGWHVCNDNINAQMSTDHPTSAVPTLQFLADFATITPNAFDPPHISVPGPRRGVRENKVKNIQGHLRVLLYSGEFDMNCNTLGTLHTLEANYWRKRAWQTADRSLWRFHDDVAGEYFTMDEVFSFLIVRNSGHLLPMDLPETALEMIERFIKNKSFADFPLPSEASYRLPDYLASAPHGPTSYQSTNSSITAALLIFLAALGLLVVSYQNNQKRNEMLRIVMTGQDEEEERQPFETAGYQTI